MKVGLRIEGKLKRKTKESRQLDMLDNLHLDRLNTKPI